MSCEPYSVQKEMFASSTGIHNFSQVLNKRDGTRLEDTLASTLLAKYCSPQICSGSNHTNVPAELRIFFLSDMSLTSFGTTLPYLEHMVSMCST